MIAWFVSLALIRAGFVFHMTRAGGEVPGILIVSGMLQDLSLLLLVFAAGVAAAWILSAVFRLSERLIFAVLFSSLSAFVWLASLSNAIYFKFFGNQLNAWVAFAQTSDTGRVGDSIVNLMQDPFLLLSLAVAIFAVIFAVFWGRKKQAVGNGFLKRAVKAASIPAILVFALVVKQSPVWFHGIVLDPSEHVFRGNVVNTSILYVWWDQLVIHPEDARAGEAEFRGKESPQAILDEYAGRSRPELKQETLIGEALRRRLALPLNRPVNLFVIFLESTRGYEFLHPWLSPRVLPELKPWIDRHGIFFEQAYSSSLEAGQTVRGMYSVLCGRLPNIGGIATYIGYSTHRTDCLEKNLSDAGYQTLSFQPFLKNYHNSMTFEALHGMKEFFDSTDIKKRRPNAPTNNWGADEKVFFEEGLKIVLEHAQNGRPIFAHFRTNTTHHPFYTDATVPLSEEVVQRVNEKVKNEDYLHYLEAMHASSENVAEFISGLFQSPIGDSSLVVLVSDHSLVMSIPTLDPLVGGQRKELTARIPIVLITKNQTHPERITMPVHQIDIAATLADVAQVPRSPDWFGNGLFSKEGRPWVFEDEGGVSYRTANRACYASLNVPGQTVCDAIPKGADPLFSRLSEVKEDPKQSHFFDQVVRANRYLIEH